MSDSSTIEKGPRDVTLTVPPSSLCGCGSGRAFGECHLKDGVFAKVVPRSINPPGPATGNKVNRCYLAFTNNCDGKLTGEHTLSRSVLSEITEKRITFSFGLRDSRDLPLNSDSLKVNRLCKRHNNSFHRIDSEAGRFVAALRSVEFALLNVGTPAQRFFIFHLFDIERWLLKTLINLYFAKLTPPDCQLPPTVFRGFEAEYSSPYGFYVQYRAVTGEPRQFQFDNTVVANVIHYRGLICGLSISLSGFQIVLSLPGPLAHTTEFISTHSFRPAALGFFRGQEMVTMYLASGQSSNRIVWLGQGDSTERPTGTVGAGAEHATGLHN